MLMEVLIRIIIMKVGGLSVRFYRKIVLTKLKFFLN